MLSESRAEVDQTADTPRSSLTADHVDELAASSMRNKTLPGFAGSERGGKRSSTNFNPRIRLVACDVGSNLNPLELRMN